MNWNALIIAFAVTVAISDGIWRRIPKMLTVAGVLVGLAAHVFIGGLASAAFATLIGFVVGVMLFRLGAIGGGDVKLMMALGAILGTGRWLTAMEIAVFAAAAVAIVQMIYRGVFTQTLLNIVDLTVWFFRNGLREHPTVNVHNSASLRAPFGIAAAIGTVMAVYL